MPLLPVLSFFRSFERFTVWGVDGRGDPRRGKLPTHQTNMSLLPF